MALYLLTGTAADLRRRITCCSTNSITTHQSSNSSSSGNDVLLSATTTAAAAAAAGAIIKGVGEVHPLDPAVHTTVQSLFDTLVDLPGFVESSTKGKLVKGVLEGSATFDLVLSDPARVWELERFPSDTSETYRTIRLNPEEKTPARNNPATPTTATAFNNGSSSQKKERNGNTEEEEEKKSAEERSASGQLIFSSYDLEGAAAYIKQNQCRKIVVMVGAGISVAAGIPDFRTPGTGLYHNLEKYQLESPEDLFTLDLLRSQPELFYRVANEMQLWPGLFPPTHVHHFIQCLEEQRVLLRCYTQNIDALERVAGVTEERLVEAHGSFGGARCVDCRTPMELQQVRACVDEARVPYCSHCQRGIVKPDVVFFGENLPPKFFDLRHDDAEAADFLIIIGTSLQVYPFAGLCSMVRDDVPRLLINRDKVGEYFQYPQPQHVSYLSPDRAGKEETKEGEAEETDTLWFPNKPRCYRDIFVGGDCQNTVLDLASLLGFRKRLEGKYTEKKMEIEGGRSCGVKKAAL